MTQPDPTTPTPTGGSESGGGGDGDVGSQVESAWNWGTPDVGSPSEWVDSIINGFLKFILEPIVSVLNGFTVDFFGVDKIRFKNDALWVLSPPADGQPLLQTAYDLVWPNPWAPMMFLGLLLLWVALNIRWVGQIFGISGMSSNYQNQRTKRQAREGAMLIVLWYPLSMAFVVLVSTVSRFLIQVNQVNGQSFGEAMAAVALGNIASNGAAAAAASTSATAASIATAISGSTVMVILFAITGILFLFIKLIFAIRQVLLVAYIVAMPLLLAGIYGNIPVLSDLCSNAARRFVPTVLLPVPAAVLIFIFQQVFLRAPAEAGFATGFATAFSLPLLLPIFAVIVLLASWKMFSYASPMTQKFVGGSGRLIGGGVLAYGALSAGASPYMAYQASRGQVGRVGMYAAADRMNTESGLFRSDGARRENTDGAPRGRSGGGSGRRARGGSGTRSKGARDTPGGQSRGSSGGSSQDDAGTGESTGPPPGGTNANTSSSGASGSNEAVDKTTE